MFAKMIQLLNIAVVHTISQQRQRNLQIYILDLSMNNQETGSSFCARFKILQPTFENAVLRSYLPSPTRQAYQLIKLPGKSIRHYLQYCLNIDDFLSMAEWRFESPKEVVHYLYAKLNKPDLEDDGIEIQLFTEHIELPLKDIQKLITSEALYFLTSCLRGYGSLFQKFKKVSVNSQTIGLNSAGECIVWLNRHLERNYAQYYALSDEVEVVKCLLSLLKEKGQATCQNIFSKMTDYVTKNKCSIKQTLAYVEKMIQYQFIRIPKQLKYLLKQNRIVQELEEIEGEKTTRIKQRKCSTEISGIGIFQTKENLFGNSHLTLIPEDNTSKFSRKLISSRNLTKRNSIMQTRLLSSKELKKSTQIFKFKSPNELSSSKDNFAYSSSYRYNSKDSGSINKSDVSTKCLKFINNVQHPDNPHSAERKRFHPSSSSRQKTTKTSQAQTTSSLIELQKNLTCKNLAKKLDPKRYATHNSILSQFSNSGAEQKVVPQEEQESEKSSPEKGNLVSLFGSKNSKNSKNSKTSKQIFSNSKDLELSFGIKGILEKINNESKETNQSNGLNVNNQVRCKTLMEDINAEEAQQLIFRGNNWTKTVVGLLESDTKLNTSLIQGSERNIYLDDVKLDMLDKLGRQMVKSLMPSAELVKKESRKQ